VLVAAITAAHTIAHRLWNRCATSVPHREEDTPNISDDPRYESSDLEARAHSLNTAACEDDGVGEAAVAQLIIAPACVNGAVIASRFEPTR